MNCFRYLGFKSFDEVNRLTIPEYNLLMKAAELRAVDTNYQLHAQAFLNFAVKAKRKAGKNKMKPVYTTFRKFFDYEKEVDKTMSKSKRQNRFTGIGKLLRKGE